MTFSKWSSLLAAFVICLLISGDVTLFFFSSCGSRPEVMLDELEQTYAHVFYLQYLAPDDCRVKVPKNVTVPAVPLEAENVRLFIRCEKSGDQYARVDYGKNPYGHFFNSYKSVLIMSIVHFVTLSVGLIILYLPKKLVRGVWKPFMVLYAFPQVIMMIMFTVDISLSQLECPDIDEKVALIQFFSTLTLPLYFFLVGLVGSIMFICMFRSIAGKNSTLDPKHQNSDKNETAELSGPPAQAPTVSIIEPPNEPRHRECAQLISLRRDSLGVIRVAKSDHHKPACKSAGDCSLCHLPYCCRLEPCLPITIDHHHNYSHPATTAAKKPAEGAKDHQDEGQTGHCGSPRKIFRSDSGHHYSASQLLRLHPVQTHHQETVVEESQRY